ncbi:hypothetical protein ACJX0J_040211, partial [Zea mays]
FAWPENHEATTKITRANHHENPTVMVTFFLALETVQLMIEGNEIRPGYITHGATCREWPNMMYAHDQLTAKNYRYCAIHIKITIKYVIAQSTMRFIIKAIEKGKKNIKTKFLNKETS